MHRSELRHHINIIGDVFDTCSLHWPTGSLSLYFSKNLTHSFARTSRYYIFKFYKSRNLYIQFHNVHRLVFFFCTQYIIMLQM